MVNLSAGLITIIAASSAGYVADRRYRSTGFPRRPFRMRSDHAAKGVVRPLKPDF
jgi:hypothetical protein